MSKGGIVDAVDKVLSQQLYCLGIQHALAVG
jgi:hypothetical protein